MKTTYQEVKDLFYSDKTPQQNLLCKVEAPFFWITFNRPKRFNAFSLDMCFALRDAILRANELETVKFIIVIGSGNHFSSGNDLANFRDERVSRFQPKLMSQAMGTQLGELCDTIIDSRKPLFAITQGKVIGFAFTQLAIYDKVFSASNSEFMAPLVKLGQGPEMCASYTFPKIFGRQKAEEILVEGVQLSAQELEKYNFISRYGSFEEAKQQCMKYLNKLNELQWNSYLASRKLIRDPERQMLKRANKKQIENLIQRWQNPNLPQYLMQYLQKRKQGPKL